MRVLIQLFLAYLAFFNCDAMAHSGWQIDKELRFQLVYLPNPDASHPGVDKKLEPVLANVPGFSPDISNIPYSNLLKLGFPIPDRSDAGGIKLFLKLYKWPKRLNSELSSTKVLDAFRIKAVTGAAAIYRFIGNPQNIWIKYALPEKASINFSANEPFTANLPGSQEELDSSLPFSSIYLKPLRQESKGDEKSAAADSAQGVIAFHTDLLKAYETSMVRLGEDQKGTKIYFGERVPCTSVPARVCELRVFEVPKSPLVFSNYRELPMPQDPNKVFLSGLLLVKRTDYAVSGTFLSSDLSKMNPGNSAFDASFRPIDSHLLEVGSVFDQRRAR